MNKYISLFLLTCSLIIGGGVKFNKISNYYKNEDQAMIVKNYKVNASTESIDNIAQNAKDSNFNTSWIASELTNQTLEIDLEKVMSIKCVTQVFAEEDVWYFYIEGSIDGIHYFEIVDAKKGEFCNVFQENASGYARYIRLTIIKSQSGFYPSSKEFYVDASELEEGINLSKGLNAVTTSEQGLYGGEKALDGNSSTYWCASNDAYPQSLMVDLLETKFVNKINLKWQDLGTYEFEINIINENGIKENLISRGSKTGINASFTVNKKIKGAEYVVFKGPGWPSLATFDVIGFNNLLNESNINANVVDLECDSYVQSVDTRNSIEISDDGVVYKKVDGNNINQIVRYVKGLSSDDAIYGYKLDTNLVLNLSGTTSSYKDESHHLSMAVCNKFNKKTASKFYQSDFKGTNEFFKFDLGRICKISEVIQEFAEEDSYNFKIEMSKDDILYDVVYASSNEIKKVHRGILNKDSYYRYIKLTAELKPDQYLTSSRFEVIGNGSPLVENWWENESGVIRFYPKEQKVTLRNITSRLDEFIRSGYKVIELHQPYEGLADIWSGLGSTNNYQVDPIIGTLDDLKLLLDKAHSKGIKVFMFGNVGYGKYNADYFKKACKDYALGIESYERDWFLFSDVCLDPSKWFWSDVAGAYYYGFWGENGKIPTYNFNNKAWQDETKKYINFWASFGVDGIALDAPDVYYWGSVSAPTVTYETITKTIRKNNLFAVPEGSGDNKFISSYKYNCIQNYEMSSWGAGAKSLSIDSYNIASSVNIEKAIKPNRDTTVALGGVSLATMNFEDKYLNASSKARILEAGLITSTGHLSFLHSGSSSRVGQDIKATWDEETNLEINRAFANQNALSSLNATGGRNQLLTNDNNKYYAYIKTDMSAKSYCLPVFNYSRTDANISIDLSNTLISDGSYVLYDAFNMEEIKVTINNSILRVSVPSSSYRVLIWR